MSKTVPVSFIKTIPPPSEGGRGVGRRRRGTLARHSDDCREEESRPLRFLTNVRNDVGGVPMSFIQSARPTPIGGRLRRRRWWGARETTKPIMREPHTAPCEASIVFRSTARAVRRSRAEPERIFKIRSLRYAPFGMRTDFVLVPTEGVALLILHSSFSIPHSPPCRKIARILFTTGEICGIIYLGTKGDFRP